MDKQDIMDTLMGIVLVFAAMYIVVHYVPSIATQIGLTPA